MITENSDYMKTLFGRHTPQLLDCRPALVFGKGRSPSTIDGNVSAALSADCVMFGEKGE